MEVNKMVNHRSNSGSDNSNRIDSNRKNNNIIKTRNVYLRVSKNKNGELIEQCRKTPIFGYGDMW